MAHTKVGGIQTKRRRTSYPYGANSSIEPMSLKMRSGVAPSHYDAGPFMSERSRHRARNADLCSSSDEEMPVQHKNAKKAHRVRQTRNKKFEESLKMAKRAKIT